MHGYGQPLLASADGGQTWAAPTGARAVNACQPNELAILSETACCCWHRADELTGVHAVRATDGRSRRSALPIGPDPQGPFELKMLPDGLLALFSGQEWSWLLLEPDEDHWCTIAGNLVPPTPVPLRLAADQLWWLSSGPSMPHSMPYANLGCGMRS